MDKFVSKNQNKFKDAEVCKYVSLPKRDCFFNSKKNLIKNYVLDPEHRLVP